LPLLILIHRVLQAANESAGPTAQQAEAGGDAGQAAGAGENGKAGQQ